MIQYYIHCYHLHIMKLDNTQKHSPKLCLYHLYHCWGEVVRGFVLLRMSHGLVGANPNISQINHH